VGQLHDEAKNVVVTCNLIQDGQLQECRESSINGSMVKL